MKLGVECQSGHRGEQEPRAFTMGERRLEVLEVVDRWIGPGTRHFKVRAGDGRSYVLRHDLEADAWELAALVGVEPADRRS